MNFLSQIPKEQLLKGIFDTLYMMLISGIFVFVIGLSLGVVLYLTEEGGLKENKSLNRAISGTINVLRSIPYVILIVIMVPLTKLITGKILGANAAIPTLVFAMSPFFARVIHMALREVSSGVIEAARSMGASTL